MARRNFAEILKEANVDIKREYERLYSSFYLQKISDYVGSTFTLHEWCERNFMNLPFRGTCVTLDDFDDFYDLSFTKNPRDFDLDYLISFCEYTYNLTINCHIIGVNGMSNIFIPCNNHYDQVMRVVEAVGYMSQYDEEKKVTIFVPKNAPAMEVATMLPEGLSYKVIEYNHHSLKGDLKRKAAILDMLAGQLEPKEKELKSINKQFSDDLFYLFNNINIRHNNEDKIIKLTQEQLEEWYDYTYEMSLIAFMLPEKKNHKDEIKELKKKLGDIKVG